MKCIGTISSPTRLLLAITCTLMACRVNAANSPLRIALGPSTVKAPPGPFQYAVSFGTLGTERVTVTVSNESEHVIEFPQKRWLFIESKREPNSPVFTPAAPYIPLVLDPGQKFVIQWRLRDATEVYLAKGTLAQIPRVSAGSYRIVIYYRAVGESAWRQNTIPLEIQVDSLGIGWVVLIVVALLAMLVLYWASDTS